MSEQTEVNYLDGDVVWVKLGSCWWPGEVVGHEKLPPDVLPSFRKPPIAVVKFFQEDSYEYVKNPNSIYKYECSRKDEFIQKGLYLYRTKHGLMEKFPEDVIRAETAVGGDIEILTRDEFQETKKESYAGLFGDPKKKTPASMKKGKHGKGKSGDLSKFSTPIRKVKEKSNYKVHILLQGSKTPSQPEETTPSTSRAGSEPSEEKTQESNDQESTKSAIITPTASSTGIYACHACPFTTTRLNVLILHNKTHSSTFTPYTPSPVKKKPSPKAQKSSSKATSKISKPRKPRQEKSEKSPRKNQAQKREAESEALPEVKKIKTDEEIKSSLLADWDDGDEDSNGESSTLAMASSPDVPIAAGSPAVPTPAELPTVQAPSEIAPVPEKKEEKPEASNDAKYDFCEDEDWPVEADVGRKIPRIKKPSIRKEETKSLSIDENDMAREVAELLNKTTVPELPSVPEPLKVEENFPEPSIVKSPDKKRESSTEGSKSPEKKSDPQPPKTIFKTKTFFRSRHSRSQDAIGKYVAEQLNAAERHDIADSEINGSDINLSPEPRISSPIEHVKVARLAPKIQLKKMNAEAAQWREREKYQIQEEVKKTYSKSDNLCTETMPSTKTNTVTVEIENKDVSKFKLETNKNEPLDKIDNEITKIENNNENVETNIKKNLINESGDNINILNNKNPLELNSPEQCSNQTKNQPLEENELIEPYMSESTASAVDALLSVSREADRVTKVISVDPPEDLFEDDNKETVNGSNINGCEDKLKEMKSNVIEKLNQESESIETTTEPSSQIENDSKTIQVPNQEIEKESEPASSKEDSLKCELVINSIETNGDKNGTEKIETKTVENIIEIVPNNIPTESDLQIAEALINLPSTTIQNKASIECQDKITLISTINNEEVQETIENPQNNLFGASETKQHENDSTPNENVAIVKTPILTNNIRFESEEEKSENLNAAQSLVQMSESIDHKINISEINASKQNDISSVLYCNKAQDVNRFENTTDVVLGQSSEKKSETIINGNTSKNESTPRLLKILEDPCTSNVSAPNNASINKKLIVPNKEKILNIDVAKSALKPKPQSTKQKIIIRRTTPNKTLLNNVTEVTTPDKIILSRTNKPSEDGSSVQSYTIQTTPDIQTDNNTIIIQQKIRKIAKPNPKLQKIKPQITPSSSVIDNKTAKEVSKPKDTVFDINSMPIVLSDDILTPESIEKMPFVMSDGNLITTSSNTRTPKGKKLITHTEKITVTSASNKPDIKSHMHHPSLDSNKVTTPNILSKSSKLRGSPKPMLVIDKTTGKQQIIMTKSETPVKEVKQTPTIIQTLPQTTNKAEKFIILPSANSPRPGRTQKIVIDPQTGKAHVVVGKGPETNTTVADNKPVSAKLLPSASDTTTPGNTVMIITNAQGTQSRIVLTPEHEKILFPNKQQASVSQLKTITQRISTNSSNQQKNVVTTVASVKTPSRIVSKQKSAIITSKGQLIVGGRLATTTQNIAPLPEIRPAPKRVSTEPKKIVQAIQKSSSEPLIFLQKSGSVMQLTAAQFEHLQRTGQIIQKVPVQSQENKVIVQKTITISPTDTLVPIQKQRVRKNLADSPTPMKKLKHEIAIAPAPAPTSPMPALTPICSTNISSSSINNPKSSSIPSSSNYSNVDNFEELLPTTAIARPNETLVAQTEQSTQPTAPLSDGQLLAVPGEHFGGPQGSFYLCVEENGTFTPIDNRPLVLENNQLVPMAEPVSALAPQPERRDILEAALANSDVFHAESTQNDAPDFRDLNANVSVHCRVSETSTTLNQPIMTPVEVPTKVDLEPTIPSSLDDGLAVIGVTPHSVPTSLELPITVTDPRIAPKTTDPLSNSNYRTSLLPSPNTEMTFVVTEETDLPAVGPISMPLLTEEESVGKSMPILTDEITERTVSSVESTAGSPSSIDVRESETEDGSQWPRRMLTPGSDISEASVEIPLQPAIQLSVSELSHNNS
ncbi:mucin-17 [Colias croceus]|uniref:mucin-17 n=1 Tax=Colias crocea TaxID=72248 RepID=UPI001E27EF68|nr:mucin-17 [Colias croceus]